MKKLQRWLSLVIVFILVLTGCSTKTEDGATSTTEQETQTATQSEATSDTSTESAESDVYEVNGLSKTEEVTLKLGIQEAGYGVAHYESIIAEFEAMFPNVKIELTASPEIGTLISTMAQAGNNDEMFDIFMGYNPYADAGLLEPLNDLLERTFYDDPETKLRDGLYKNVEDMIFQNQEGYIFKLPKAMYIGGLFFDRNLFEEKGWNQNPKTWDEFMSLCAEIKADGMTPVTFSGLYNYLGFSVWWHKAFEMAEQAGENELKQLKDDFIGYTGNRYNNEYMIRVYEKVYEMGKAGYFSSGLSALNHTQSQMQVLQGKTAMVSTADWVENEMKREGATPEGFTWGYMALPMVDEAGDTIWINSGDSDSLVVWKEKPELNKAWAKEFILFTYNVSAQKITAELASALPVRAAFYESEENKNNLLTSQKAIFEYMNNNSVQLETNYTIRPVVGPSDSQADKIYTEGVSQIAEGLQDPKELLDEAQKYFEMGLEEGKALE